jgi:hypothetical protein
MTHDDVKRYTPKEIEWAISRLCDYDSNEVPHCVDALEWAASEYLRARGVIEWYANEDRWRDFQNDESAAAFDRNFGTEFSADLGQRARDWLGGGG